MARPSLPLLLVLAAAVVAHATNIVDFPAATADEGLTLHRAMVYLQTGSPNDPAAPGAAFFGSLVLGLIFWCLGFPDPTIASSLSLRGAPALSDFTIWTFWFIPRAIMVALVVIDTYLIYYLGRRLSERVEPALAAAAIFAVAPLGLYYRLVVLDNIAMALVMGSMVFLLASPETNDRGYSLFRLGAAILFLLAVLTSLVPLFLFPAVLLLLRTTRRPEEGSLTPLQALPRLAWALTVLTMVILWSVSLALWGAQGASPFPASTIIDAQDKGGLALGLLRLDPIVVGLGVLGLVLALGARRAVLVLWALGGLAYVLLAPGPSDTAVIPLVPALALAAGGVVGGPGRRRRQRLPRGRADPGLSPLAVGATVAVALTLLLQTVATGSQDASTPQIAAVQYAMANVAPDGLVVSNPAYWWIMTEFEHRFTAVQWQDPELRNLTSTHGKVYVMVDRAYLVAMADTGPTGRLLQALYLQAQPIARFGGAQDQVEVRARLMSTLVVRVHYPSGNPQVGSRLMVTPSGSSQAVYDRTTDNGTHQVGLRDGAYTLEAYDASGNALGARTVVLQRDLTVAFLDAPGQTLRALGIQVNFENGDPVPWAFVQVNTTPTSRIFADRNPQSNYLLFLPPATYAVRVQGALGQALATQGVDLTSDQRLNLTEARPPGVAQAEHDLVLYLVRGNLGVGDLLVTVKDGSGHTVAQGITSFDGRYAARLPSGGYLAQVTLGTGQVQSLQVPLQTRDFVRVVPIP